MSGAGATVAITVSSDVHLSNFSLTITNGTTVPEFVAVHMPVDARRLRASGLQVRMQQTNVSNAFKVFGSGFELGPDNTVHQSGSCLYPNYGPDSDHTPFQPSTLLYLQGAVGGWVHGNRFFWRCSMMDMDVSDRVVFEDNDITCTEEGVVPHGNSISGWGWG